MKVVILAGGFGTRLSEYTRLIPKPMVIVGGKPILYHIMKHYYNYGFKYLSIILFIYMLNSAIDIAILFSGFSQIAERPYFSVFQLSRPLFLICLIWIAIVHKDQIKDA